MSESLVNKIELQLDYFTIRWYIAYSLDMGSKAMVAELIENQIENGVEYFAGIKPESLTHTLLLEIHGDQWCLFGDDRRSDISNDPLFFSKFKVFGFTLAE